MTHSTYKLFHYKADDLRIPNLISDKIELARYERKKIEFMEVFDTCPAEPDSPTPSYSSAPKRSNKIS